MVRLLLAFIGARSKTSLLVLSTLSIVIVGSADYFTGYYLSLGIFYIFPTGLLAWYVSRQFGLAAALLSALVWYFVNAAFAPPQVGAAIPVWNSLVRLGYFGLISTLLSSLREAYDHEKELARIDPLTGLLNSRAFADQARIELARATRNRSEVAVLYLDLDNFKALNDSGGHAAGDALLRTLGHTFARTLRTTDLIGRLGGDEFAFLLAGTAGPQLEVAASRIQAAVQEASANFSPRVSATIGAVTSDGSEDIETLIQLADNLMYAGKASAKGSFRTAFPPGEA